VSDVTETREQPKSLRVINTIPDSDDDEDDELPDAPEIQHGDTQIPASNLYHTKDSMLLTATKPTGTEEVSEGQTAFGEVSQPAIRKQEQERKVATSPSNSNSEKGNRTSLETSSSPVKTAMAPPTRKNAGARSTAKRQTPQPAEDITAVEPTSSPPKSQEATKVHVKSLEQSLASTTDESSQASDMLSSPLEPTKGESFKAKRKESPNASFTAPAASQTTDIVMAELKAMKIVSPLSLVKCISDLLGFVSYGLLF
jgi:hypothetical protein